MLVRYRSGAETAPVHGLDFDVGMVASAIAARLAGVPALGGVVVATRLDDGGADVGA